MIIALGILVLIILFIGVFFSTFSMVDDTKDMRKQLKTLPKAIKKLEAEYRKLNKEHEMLHKLETDYYVAISKAEEKAKKKAEKEAKKQRVVIDLCP